MLQDKLLNLPIDTGNFGDLKDRGPLVFILVQDCLNQELKISTRSFWQWLTLLIYNHVENSFDTFTIEGLFQGD